ncbi:YhgE/Pip domain-containing protein [Aquibacillus koreensis]|uniref:YhgE/Pip domain-containing protein n=1 Tax=Aquibacillus koreensis TaxID=279446 RepID=A0A9X3WPV5_9BACI|nr:YhgE/Pip domain-containing protein [Aquibacillus koreensis]MCT2535504.1 YhgE/Pip domain-containing protein [Aquibacillus koreensis]MDC3422683.1 YhgE/Pip domain-containing protein [Aquibacillus koreensis]
MKTKRILLGSMAAMLVLPSFLVTAASDESNAEENNIGQQDGSLSYKDEVIYAALQATGEQDEMYVVNNFEVTEAGEIVDYGSYDSLKNLTNLDEIEQADNKIIFTAPEGKYYYQGNMDDVPLPWNIDVSYWLDDKAITPDELAGKDGHVEIKIETSANEQVDDVFFNNYLLQISLTLDPTVFTNMEAKDGMVANAGKNKQITFTVMPEKNGNLSLEADVVDFELQGIDIKAVPSSMSIDSPDMEDMTGDMASLTDAIAKINDGVSDLNGGVTDLNDGVWSLRNGSSEFNDGISDINGSSSELIEASAAIKNALKEMSTSLENSDEMELSGLEKLVGGLSEMATGLNETATGLDSLRDNYIAAYQGLDQAMAAIPSYEITDKEIESLPTSGADQEEVVDQLVETYKAAQTAKGTYTQAKEAFDAVGPSLSNTSTGFAELEKNLTTMVDELTSSIAGMDVSESLGQLQEGLSQLSTNYEEFHVGLGSYTDGVGQLAHSYSQLHDGIVDVSVGTSELEDGVGELAEGTTELEESTSNLPDEMQEEIDQMIADFENSDFEPVSFVSPSNNDKINNVQFIIKTESIEKEEQEETEEQPKQEKGFWERLMDLFK